MKTAATPVTIILASASPRRQELVRMLGMPVVIRPSDADERTPADWPPERVVEELSQRKAKAVWEQARESAEHAVVVGSDTLVTIDGRILGKPRDEEDAAEMLRLLSGRTHEVYTGLCCIGHGLSEPAGGAPEILVSHTVSKVTFRPMSEEEIRAYIRTGEPMDKAGSYGIQGIGAVFIDRIEGDFFSIMGLPVSLLYQMLLRFGASPFA